MMSKQSIAVLGAGHAGCATAADLSLYGYKVNFYEIPEFATSDTSNFKPILETGEIQITGLGPKQRAKIHKVTTEIKEAIEDTKIILLPIPAEAHEAFFNVMIPYLKDGQVVVITPGNFGSLRLRKLLQQKTREPKITIYETTMPFYAARVVGAAKLLFLLRWGPKAKPEDYPIRNPWTVAASALPAKDTDVALRELQELCPEIFPVKNILAVGFSNPCTFLHPISTLLNLGFIEYARDKFFLWRDGATPSVVRAEQAQADEIDRVAEAFGVETSRFKGNEGVDSAMEEYRGPLGLLAMAYGPGKIRHRYITEDLAYGLVPISQLAKKVGVRTPITDGLIAIASEILQEDFLKTGRTLETLGLAELNREQIIELVEG